MQLEQVVKESFALAGRALKKLRDNRLYRSTHHTFEQYCREIFGMKRAHPYRLIEAFIVVAHLKEKCLQIGDIFPTNESQVRPLTQLSPQDQVAAWAEAVEVAGQRVPTAKIVSEVVRKRIAIPCYAPNPWKVGDIASIAVKGNPELKGRGGSWGIIHEVFEFSCRVKVWDGVIPVKTENLKELPLPLDQRDSVKALCERSHRLVGVDDLEGTARGWLELLGQKTWLSELEETLLGKIEDFYFGVRP